MKNIKGYIVLSTKQGGNIEVWMTKTEREAHDYIYTVMLSHYPEMLRYIRPEDAQTLLDRIRADKFKLAVSWWYNYMGDEYCVFPEEEENVVELLPSLLEAAEKEISATVARRSKVSISNPAG